MKKILLTLISLAVTLISGCGTISESTASPEQESFIAWKEENKNPIAAVYNLTEEDIEKVYFSGSQYREGKHSFERQEQYTFLINNLKKTELLESVEGFTPNITENYLSYEIHLKNANPITLYFYGNVIDFGQGFYFYKDADESTFPSDTSFINIGLLDFQQTYTYKEADDIKSLCSLLATSKNTGESVQIFDDSSELMSIYAYGGISDASSLFIKEENGAYFLLKSFFTSYIYVGEISLENYNSLVLACKGQFGTQEHFYVKSGETTIYPLGHFLGGVHYNEQTGEGILSDGFPQLSDWADKLESVYYDRNFVLWVKDDEIPLYISIADTRVNLTYEDIEALPVGEYIIECRSTPRGEYVMKADNYNSSTYIYWFKLVKP